MSTSFQLQYSDYQYNNSQIEKQNIDLSTFKLDIPKDSYVCGIKFYTLSPEIPKTSIWDFILNNRDVFIQWMPRLYFSQRIHESPCIQYFHTQLHKYKIAMEMSNHDSPSYILNSNYISQHPYIKMFYLTDYLRQNDEGINCIAEDINSITVEYYHGFGHDTHPEHGLTQSESIQLSFNESLIEYNLDFKNGISFIDFNRIGDKNHHAIWEFICKHHQEFAQCKPVIRINKDVNSLYAESLMNSLDSQGISYNMSAHNHYTFNFNQVTMCHHIKQLLLSDWLKQLDK
jgi:hypothetical protein